MFHFIHFLHFEWPDNVLSHVLVDSSANACVIVMLAATTSILLKKSSAAARHLVWATAFLSFLLLPVLSCTIPKWRVLSGECERACDDLVLQSGIEPSDYAEDLLSLLVKGAIPSAALAIIRPSELEGRLRAILSETVNRNTIKKRVLGLALAASIATTTSLATLQAPSRPAPQTRAHASSNPANPDTPPIQKSGQSVSVVCVDADGDPVPGAEVHLFQLTGGEKGRYLDFGPLKSDAQGRVGWDQAKFTNDVGNFDRWIYARLPGRLIGFARSAKWTNRAVINPDGKVKLFPSRSVEGHVTVPAGFDPTKVVVRTRTMWVYSGDGFFDYESFAREDSFPGLDTALPEIFECRPDVQGRIHFGDVPVRGQLYLVTVGAGLAEAQWRNQTKTFDQLISLTIPEESALSGRVLEPDGTPAVGVKVTARLSPSVGRQISYLSSFRAETDENGEFAIHGLPQIELSLRIEDPRKQLTFRPLENLLVEPHKDPKLTLKLETGVRVSGRVLANDGKPVQGAFLSALTDDTSGSGLDDDGTDADGRYQLSLPSGGAKLYFNSLPDGFVYPKPQIIKQLEIKPGQADIQNLDFTLERQSSKGK